ncbi:WD40 repeat domain-containing protein [Spirillospora sp. CA-294931]|uniref:WD40 repeat domain-containing protein n=1 Tax=Spirillospora sp. CA-294931 TaxID=3240042 RepID=UPI003D8A3D12
MSPLDDLLDARPTEAAWRRACPLLADLDAAALAAVAPRVLAWPAQLRPMPDDWWAQWTAGDRRPHHDLAGTRMLGTLDHVELGRVAEGPGGEDEAEGAYFYHGATGVAAPSGLSWLALGAAAEWHHNGGDVVRWSTLSHASLIWYLEGDEYHDEAVDLQLSPDGGTLVTAVEGRWHAWSAATGDELWVDSGSPDQGLVRFAFSADGRRVAAGTESGTVAVIETASGRRLLTVPASGPVALDATGDLLAHTTPEGDAVVRDTGGGAVVTTVPTSLTQVNALALAPDGGALLAVGEGTQMIDLRTGTPGEPAHPADLPLKLDATCRYAVRATRALWTDTGPLAYIVTDGGSALLNAEGRALWAHPTGVIGAFTPDGRALVTVGDTIEAWFVRAL